MRALYGHAKRVATEAAKDIERATEAAHSAGPASRIANAWLPEAITASERDLLMACEVLLDAFTAMCVLQ